MPFSIGRGTVSCCEYATKDGTVSGTEDLQRHTVYFRDGVSPSASAIRGVLGDVLFSIRFPLMGVAEFGYDVATSGVLTAEVLGGSHFFR